MLSWSKLLSVTKLVFGFLEKIKGSKITQLMKNQKYWIIMTQESYAAVCHCSNEPLKHQLPDTVQNVNLLLHDGLLRCHGRTDHASIHKHTGFPLLLFKKHHITELITQSTQHGELQETLCKVKEHFWIPEARQKIKPVIK